MYQKIGKGACRLSDDRPRYHPYDLGPSSELGTHQSAPGCVPGLHRLVAGPAVETTVENVAPDGQLLVALLDEAAIRLADLLFRAVADDALPAVEEVDGGTRPERDHIGFTRDLEGSGFHLGAA